VLATSQLASKYFVLLKGPRSNWIASNYLYSYSRACFNLACSYAGNPRLSPWLLALQSPLAASRVKKSLFSFLIHRRTCHRISQLNSRINVDQSQYECRLCYFSIFFQVTWIALHPNSGFFIGACWSFDQGNFGRRQCTVWIFPWFPTILSGRMLIVMILYYEKEDSESVWMLDRPFVWKAALTVHWTRFEPFLDILLDLWPVSHFHLGRRSGSSGLRLLVFWTSTKGPISHCPRQTRHPVLSSRSQRCGN
jgi:hypothetical protein